MITVRRRRIAEDDPFFDEGNSGRPTNMPCLPAAPLVDKCAEGEVSMAYHDMIACPYPNCAARLKSVQSYELHVHMAHQHRCNECGMDFTSDRLLDMHISELHDSYFAALAKKRPSYQCVVEGCPQLFWNNKDRRKHLLSLHDFPWTYDFHEPAKFRRIRKAKLKRDKRRAENSVDMKEERVDEQEGDTMEVSSAKKTLSEKKEGKHIPTANSKSESMDIDDEISSSLSKMRLVPDKLSFGRRGRGRGFERGRGRGRGRGMGRGRGRGKGEGEI